MSVVLGSRGVMLEQCVAECTMWEVLSQGARYSDLRRIRESLAGGRYVFNGLL
jgi:hypothetical protein